MCLSNVRYEKLYDDYSIIMVKALADRLAEVIRCIMNYLPVSHLLSVPWHNLSLASHAFRVSAPKIWNSSSHSAISDTLFI